MNIDKQILSIDKVISANISVFDDSERGLLSQNILAQLRNFVEHICLKILGNGQDIENTYPNIVRALTHVNARGDLRFLSKFHDFLLITASHYTLDEENSERLMLKYYEYLLKIKAFLKNIYDLDVLNNINEFPLDTDPALREYYKKIAEKINPTGVENVKTEYANSSYYIQKIKPFFDDYKVYYEVTFTVANDRASKFDRIIAFTKLDISPYYAVKLAISNDHIEVMGKKMPIQIIQDWEVSIRPCELDHFADIFGKHSKQSRTLEYEALMSFLKKTGLNLVEVLDFPEQYYQRFKRVITEKARTVHLAKLLDKCRVLTKSKGAGNNVIRYLLYRLNNKIIKSQYIDEACEKLSNLNLNYGCIPFEQMPFTTSLIYHNPKLLDLFDCLEVKGREHELFARYIKNNIEIKGELYTLKKDITGFEGIDALVEKYNNKLYQKHGNRKIEEYRKRLYIRGYEEDTLDIISRLQHLSIKGIQNYSTSFDSWLQSANHIIDCEEKKEKLRIMFEKSEVAIIYGSAGTGKTTLINHLSNFFDSKNKLYLANTNPAVDNLRRRVTPANSTFMTITKFLSNRNTDIEFDLLVIDECSTVSNSDMREILKKAKFKLLVLVGDTFQIESIRFGNWFSMAKEFVPKYSVFELVKPYRSTNIKLLDLWSRVRNLDENILEHIAKNDYSVTLNESIFDHSEEDEIILCLNYDGLYGINNINRFLQSNNPNEIRQWGVQTYKVGDPILFNESERFTPLIYNNLKGEILDIQIFTDRIQFDIEIDKVINELDAQGYDFQLIDNPKNNNALIRFSVNKLDNTDEDDNSLSTIVPFQIAYAVSIHKAQGLEYNSVKIVITNETEEMITHNIFYTAITRAREKLKIYWTPETEKKVLSGLKARNNQKDVDLFSLKFNFSKNT